MSREIEEQRFRGKWVCSHEVDELRRRLVGCRNTAPYCGPAVPTRLEGSYQFRCRRLESNETRDRVLVTNTQAASVIGAPRPDPAVVHRDAERR